MGKSSKRKKQQKPTLITEDAVVADSDDEEISEDGAFDSDDERKYGMFFDSAKDGSDDDEDEGSSDSEEDSSSDDEDGDGGQYMLDLLNQIDSKPLKEEKVSSIQMAAAAAHVKESPSAVLAQQQGESLTLDTLLQGISDTQGFGALQQQLRKSVVTTEAPVARVVADRARRQVEYEHQQKEVSQWNAAVQENRKAETLDFRPKEKLRVTRDVMVSTFVPTTDLEKEIHAALEQEGGDEEALRKAEDDLGANQMTLEEYRARRDQLAQMRALMFYHEQKSHHIKKIKSKQYRRIRKKQREKQKERELLDNDGNPELLRELQEKEELDRMKERATLAHKNTSKWAKRILKRGKNVDADTRKALSAQLKRGDDLRKRMNATTGSDDDDDDEDLIAAAKKTLQETEHEAKAAASTGAGKSLFKLAFMQKGVEKQREKAKEEARQLLLELEATHEEHDAEDEEEETKRPKKTKRAKAASKDEMSTFLKDGDLMVSSMKLNNGVNVATDGDVNVEQFGGGKTPQQHGEHMTTFEPKKRPPSQQQASSLVVNEDEKEGSTSAMVKSQTQGDDSNPWMMPSEGEKKKSSSKRSSPVVRGYVDVERAVDLLESTPKDATNSNNNEGGELESSDNTSKKVTLLSQEELVRMAFAGPSKEDMESEFAAEKDLVRQEEVTSKKKKKTRDLSSAMGWGSWTGSGVRPPKRARREQVAKTEDPQKRRRDDKRPTVIISQARIKRTANKYMLADVPYPFQSREEYEKSISGGIGREWNVTDSFKSYTRPEIITRAGKIIKPISKKMKVKRAPAKF